MTIQQKVEKIIEEAISGIRGIPPTASAIHLLYQKEIEKEIYGKICELDLVDYKPSKNVSYKAIKWDDIHSLFVKQSHNKTKEGR